ncbi:MAG: hypothetical protein ACT4PT_01340 [Methanobacteriota archaeon]
MALRVLHNTTLETAAKIQAVLEAADAPLSRYEIFHRLGGSVNYRIIDSVLDHFEQLGVVRDEGKGGHVSWIGARIQVRNAADKPTPAKANHPGKAQSQKPQSGPVDEWFCDMPPSEVPRDNLDRVLKVPTATSYRMWHHRTPEERMRASFALTAMAARLREGRRRDARA